MNYRLNLSNVSSKYGAPMGRAESLPEDRNQPILLHLTRVRLNSGGYDRGGAYWGNDQWDNNATAFHPLYCAESDDGSVSLFVRPTIYRHFALSKEWRDEAKTLVRRYLPNARFYQ